MTQQAQRNEKGQFVKGHTLGVTDNVKNGPPPKHGLRRATPDELDVVIPKLATPTRLRREVANVVDWLGELTELMRSVKAAYMDGALAAMIAETDKWVAMQTAMHNDAILAPKNTPKDNAHREEILSNKAYLLSVALSQMQNSRQLLISMSKRGLRSYLSDGSGNKTKPATWVNGHRQLATTIRGLLNGQDGYLRYRFYQQDSSGELIDEARDYIQA